MAVYFIRAGDDGPVKIGYANNLCIRLESLRAASPYDLKVIRTFQLGDHLLERRLHQHFKHLRVRHEWFHFTPEMLTMDLENRAGYEPGLLSCVS
jgi:hypothetical protein